MTIFFIYKQINNIKTKPHVLSSLDDRNTPTIFFYRRDKMEKLKREIYKNKYYWVVREKGKIRAKRKYTKRLNKDLIFSIYKNNNTLYENLVKKRLKTKDYSEFIASDFKDTKPKTLKSRPYRIQITALVRKELIIANSKTLNWRRISEAKQEAYNRFYMAVASRTSDGSDIDEGKDYSDKNIRNIEERIIYYDN